MSGALQGAVPQGYPGRVLREMTSSVSKCQPGLARVPGSPGVDSQGLAPAPPLPGGPETWRVLSCGNWRGACPPHTSSLPSETPDNLGRGSQEVLRQP